MINALLHKQPVAADRNEHASLRMKVPVTDWSVAKQLNAVFVAGGEFGDAVREFPVVFIQAGDGDNGQPDFAPIAVLGLVQDDNLFVADDNTWRANYMPAVLAAYPFGIGRIDAERFAICFDAAWSGLSGTEGEPLFMPDGAQSPMFQRVQTQLETLEAQIQRTRLMGRRLNELGLLREMRFDATLPDGRKFTVDGFYTVDEKKLNDLDAETVLGLHKNGLLGLIHAHYVSLGNMRKLLDWHIARLNAAAAKA